MPADLVTRLNKEVDMAMNSPQLAQTLSSQAFIVTSKRSPGEFASYIKQESAKYKQLIEAANIKID